MTDRQPPPPDDDRTVLDPHLLPALQGSRRASAAAVDTASHALPLGTRLYEFEVTSLLGVGGFGIVYVAFDHSLKREVAVKEYMPSSLASRKADAITVVIRSAHDAPTFDIGLRSFINEAQLLAQFDHPALLKVFRFWEANGTAYMAMPWYRGQTLHKLLAARDAAPDEAWILALLQPLLGALEVMHAAQCFHRDIAPDNIMLQPDGRPVLLDLGAARRVISGMTQALTVILKAGYAPIEQYADAPGAQQGPWTDLYALGAVVHQMITGRTPPPSVARLLSDTMEPLSSAAQGRYSAPFLRAIDSCLSVKSEGRPQSVAQLRAMLAEAAPQPAQVAQPARAAIGADDQRTRILPLAALGAASASSSAAARPQSRAKLLVAGVAALLLIGAGATWMATRRADSPANAAPASKAPAAPVVVPVNPPVATPAPDPAVTAAPDTAAASAVAPPIDAVRKPPPTTSAAKPQSKREPRATEAPPRSAAVEEAERKYVEELNKKLDSLLEDKQKK
jgi:serine/threonine protein kinase